MLYWFAEYSFGCDRLIMGNVVINSGMFCFVGYKWMRMWKGHQVSETCWFVVSVNHVFCFGSANGCLVWVGLQITFCLCCKFFGFFVVLTVVPYCNKASSACPLHERRRWSQECEWCSAIVEIDCWSLVFMVWLY